MQHKKHKSKPVLLESVIKEIRPFGRKNGLYDSEEGIRKQVQDPNNPIDEDGCRIVLVMTKFNDKTRSFGIEKRRIKVS